MRSTAGSNWCRWPARWSMIRLSSTNCARATARHAARATIATTASPACIRSTCSAANTAPTCRARSAKNWQNSRNDEKAHDRNRFEDGARDGRRPRHRPLLCRTAGGPGLPADSRRPRRRHARHRTAGVGGGARRHDRYPCHGPGAHGGVGGAVRRRRTAGRRGGGTRQQRGRLLLSRHPRHPRRTDRTDDPAARPDALEKLPRLRSRHGAARQRIHPKHVLLLGLDALPGHGALHRHQGLRALFLESLRQRGRRARRPRDGRVSRRRGDRPLRALAQMAAYRPAAGRADFARQLCAAGAARAVARPPLHRPRLVEPPVRTAVLLHARLRDAPYPPLHDPLPALNGLGAGLRPARERSRRR